MHSTSRSSAGLSADTERAMRTRSAYACAGSAYHTPRSVLVARKVRQLLIAAALLLLLSSGSFIFEPHELEEALVASEVEEAPAMVREQVKVEKALQLAVKEAQ